MEKIDKAYIEIYKSLESKVKNSLSDSETVFVMLDALHDTYLSFIQNPDLIKKMERMELSACVAYMRISVRNRFRRLQKEKGIGRQDIDFTLLSDNGELTGSIDYAMLLQDMTKDMSDADKSLFLQYISGKTERELASENGISQPMIHKKLKRIKGLAVKNCPAFFVNIDLIR